MPVFSGTPTNYFPLLRKRGLETRFTPWIGGLFLLMLILRPFVDRFELNPDAVRLVSLVDFSGSMDRADREGDERRINQVLPFFDLERSDSWINQAKARYGSVDRLGFAGDEVSSMRASSGIFLPKGKTLLSVMLFLTYLTPRKSKVLTQLFYFLMVGIIPASPPGSGRIISGAWHPDQCDWGWSIQGVWKSFGNIF